MQTRNLHRERFASLGPSRAPARRPSPARRGFIAAAAAGLALATTGCTIIVNNDLTPQCSKHSDCQNLSTAANPVICNEQQHVCVPLLTDECGKPGSKYNGAFFHKTASTIEDGTIILGAVLTLSGPTDADYSSGGKPPRDAMVFALNQINSQGIPWPALKGQRSLAILACDDYSQDDGEPVTAAKHLAEDIGVPAIIGGTGTGVTASIAKKATLNDGVLLFSPSATGTALSALTTQDPRHLVWRTGPPDSYQSKAMAAYVKLQLTTQATPVDPKTAKIYIFNQSGDYGENFGSQVQRDLASLTMNNIQRVNFGNTGEEGMTVARTLGGAVPDAVILIGYDDTVPYMQEVEASVAKAEKKPFYMFPDGGETTTLWDKLAQNTDLRLRVFGTAPGQLRATEPYSTFINEMKATDDAAQPEIFGSAGAYDIVYLLSFAMSRLLNTTNVTGPITSADLARQLTHVSKGAKLTVGRVDLAENLHTAQNSADFDFEGASGHLQFGTQGEAPSDIQVWCVPPSPNPKSPLGAQTSNIYYDPVTNVLNVPNGTKLASCEK